MTISGTESIESIEKRGSPLSHSIASNKREKLLQRSLRTEE